MEMYVAPAVVCMPCFYHHPKGTLHQFYELRCKVVRLEHGFLHLQNVVKALESDLLSLMSSEDQEDSEE